MTDGQRLSKALTEYGHSKEDLADAIGVSRAMAYKYTKAVTFNKTTRAKIQEGLKKLKIDPAVIAPSHIGVILSSDEMRELLHGIPTSALAQVRQLLLIEDARTKNGLIALVDEKLSAKKFQ